MTKDKGHRRPRDDAKQTMVVRVRSGTLHQSRRVNVKPVLEVFVSGKLRISMRNNEAEEVLTRFLPMHEEDGKQQESSQI